MMLLVGGDSEIGAATCRYMKAQGVTVYATTRRRDQVVVDRPFLDLAMDMTTWEPPPDTRSAGIFVANARLTACAADPMGSAEINVTRTLALIERLIERDIAVLFLSTNQVFDGATPHVRTDAATCPVSEYGRQKARVEIALRQHISEGAAVSILRLSKVISPAFPLVHRWIEVLAAGRMIQAFRDMALAPIPIDLASVAIRALMQDRLSGIFQLSGPRDVTYAEIGRFLADQIGVDQELVTELNARDAGLPEGATPRHTTLDSGVLRECYGLHVPDVWSIIEPKIAGRRFRG